MVGGCAWSKFRVLAPNPGAILCKAMMTYIRKRAGSLSSSSSESHATGSALLLIHSATSVVLPNPAGAESSVKLPYRPAFRRSIKPGRGTEPGRDAGINSFVVSISFDMDIFYRIIACRKTSHRRLLREFESITCLNHGSNYAAYIVSE